MLRLPVFPHLPQAEYAISLDGARYRVRLTWRERLAAWYLDLLTQDGEPIVSGRRLSAQFDPISGLLPEGRPDGVLLVRGTNLTQRAQLGTDVHLLYVPRDELPDEVVPDEGYRVVVS